MIKIVGFRQQLKKYQRIIILLLIQELEPNRQLQSKKIQKN